MPTANQLAPLHKAPRHRSTARKITAINYHANTGPEALRATVALIGKGIRAGAKYPPLIHYARRLASRANPKDYLTQFKNAYEDVTKRWRYVHDPRAVEMLAISGPEIYGQILGADMKPPDHGYGDCDDSTILLGAIAESQGFKTRIITLSPPTLTGSQKLFSHVYPEVLIPKVGWIGADAVGFPQHGLGWRPPALRQATWDTRGNLINFSGYFPQHFQREFKQMAAANIRGLSGLDGLEGVNQMGSLHGVETSQFQDYGLENFGFAGVDGDEPADWSKYGLLNFGAYVDQPLPMVGGDSLGFFAEYDEDDIIGYAGQSPIIRSKMFEMDPKELAYAYRTGRPRLGCVALGDDGDVYQWIEDPALGGFFKKLFKRAKKGIKKVARKIKGKAKKLIKKLPGGKTLVKIAGKVKKVALKALKPILKAGKFLAPVAALIPGYGPVIAAALAKGPKMLKIVQKLGIMTDSKGKPKFKSKKQKRAFAKEVKKQAAKMKRKAGRRRGKRRPLAAHPRMLQRGSRRWQAQMRGYGLDYYDCN